MEVNRTLSTVSVDWKSAQEKAARTARWAVTMVKVRVRQVVSRTRWQLVTFYGKSGGESVGVVDMLAIRKDHSEPLSPCRRGDALQIILIQVKGGSAAWPTLADAASCAQSQRDTVRVRCFLRRGRREGCRISFACAEQLPENLVLKSQTSVFR